MARVVRKIVVGLALALACHGLALAGPVEDGLEAAKKNDYATALRLWTPAAEQGDGTAQSYLARLYLMGWGVSQDHAKAAAWYLKAAEQGNTAAQNNLGTLYEHGDGVPQDYAKALYWFRKAAEAHALEAYINVARAYEDGHGVKQSCEEATAWYQRAVKGGYPAERITWPHCSN